MNLEKFRMLLQRPIKKSLSKLNREESEISNKETSSIFQSFSLFRNFSFQMQPEIEVTNNNHRNKFSDLISQNILTYRKISTDLSLLEKIMITPESKEFISFVWNECDFWRDSASLTTVRS
jgi:hypothetical protein